MLKIAAALAALSLLIVSAQAAPAAKPADPAPVLAAERAFAARAAVVGMSPSFLEYMTDDAVIFAPDPILARAFYGAVPVGKAPKDGGTLLNWWPNFAGMARSGDLGFTTGPATINGKRGLFYVTVWVRQKDGGWKWVYDGGIDADGAAAPGPEAASMLLPPGEAKPLAPALAMGQVRSRRRRARRARQDRRGSRLQGRPRARRPGAGFETGPGHHAGHGGEGTGRPR